MGENRPFPPPQAFLSLVGCDAEVHAVSAVTSEGIEELKGALENRLRPEENVQAR